MVCFIQKASLQMKRSGGSIEETNEETRAFTPTANNLVPTLCMDITMYTPPKRNELTLESFKFTYNYNS